MRRAGRLLGVIVTVAGAAGCFLASSAAADDILIRGATVVTMDADHTVIPRGRVLVADSQIEAVWRRGRRPGAIDGRRLRRAKTVEPGRDTYVFPGLAALGGDSPPAAGGTAPDSNTYSYLKARWANGAFAAASDAEFRAELTNRFGLDRNGRLNLEAIQMIPPIDDADDFLAHLLNGDVDPTTGLIADPTPPFGLYEANLNHRPGG